MMCQRIDLPASVAVLDVNSQSVLASKTEDLVARRITPRLIGCWLGSPSRRPRAPRVLDGRYSAGSIFA